MSRARQFQVGLALALFALSAAFALATPGTVRAASSPTITAITPSQGPSLGGTFVTVTGTDFQPGVNVYIGGLPGISVARVNATQITFTTPRANATIGGPANVLVVNTDGGAVSQTAGFFYTPFESALAITSVAADRGSNSGGATVTVTGAGFSSAASVYFGNVPATSVNTLGASAMFVRTPPNVSGTVAVTVVNPDGARATLAKAYTYDGGVTVSGVTPGGGVLAGGTTVSISGYGFAPGATVNIGDAAATSVIVVNSTQVVAVTPPGAAGTARITVTNPGGGSGVLGQGFTYGPAANSVPPVIAGLTPAAGSTQGGTQVVLNGTGFSGGAAVYFGGVPSASVTWNGPSSIFARAPSNVAGTVSVTIVNGDGASMTLPNAYTYQGGEGMSVLNVKPASGPGGTVVTVNGSGFNGGSWVTFDGTPAASSTMIGSTQMVATAPAGVSGMVTIAVTQVGGLTARLPGAYTFTDGGGAPAPTPPAAPPATAGSTGVFVAPPIFSASGQALVIFAGGTVDQLEGAASSTKAAGAWVQDAGGAYQLLVVGGPSFLKDLFAARFPSGLSANTVVTLTR